MIEKSNREKILSLFLESPTKQFQIREACRLSGISLPSTRGYLISLEKEGLVRKLHGNVFPYFAANRESKMFKILKINHWRLKLEESGLLQELRRIYPECIVLFGSCSQGEDTEKSDLDLFVQAGHSRANAEKFEKILQRKISIFFEQDPRKLQKELKNSLANGLVLEGRLDLF